MKLNEWIPLSKVSTIPEEVQFINCDTRDFHVFLSTEPSSIQEQIIAKVNKNIVSLAHVFGYGGSIPSAGTNFSDKWNRFGTWQHLEINDPSQG